MVTKKELEREYLKNKKSTRECARLFGISQPVIRYYMKKYNIKGRPYTENKIPLKKGDKMPEKWKKSIAKAMTNNPRNYMRGGKWRT